MSAHAVPWSHLTAAAMLGTERQEPDVQVGGELGRLLSGLDAHDKEGALLAAAGALALCRRIGRLPETAVSSRPEPAPPAREEVPVLSARASRFLLQMLDGTCSEALPEFLAAAARKGRRVRPEHLPAVLSFGQTHRAARADLIPVLGKRGCWLADANPDWQYAAGSGEESPQALAALWETSTGEARRSLVRRVRGLAPALGLELVKSTWKDDAAEERAAFLAAFEIGLGDADEPFLEEALDDKSKRVRAQAAALLARLPGSRLVARMIARLSPLVSLDAGKKGMLAKLAGAGKRRLEIRLPEECDNAMQRDGIEPTPPPTEKKIGAKAWMLLQMLSAVPPAHLCRACSASPEDLLAAAKHTEWHELLREAWSRAAERFADLPMALALLNDGLLSDGLLALLPAEAKEKTALRALGRSVDAFGDDKDGVRVVSACTHAWSSEFTRTVLALAKRSAADAGPQGGVRLLRRLPDWALRVPTAFLGEASSGWPSGSGWEKPLERFVQLVRFRHDMIAAIEEE